MTAAWIWARAVSGGGLAPHRADEPVCATGRTCHDRRTIAAAVAAANFPAVGQTMALTHEASVQTGEVIDER